MSNRSIAALYNKSAPKTAAGASNGLPSTTTEKSKPPTKKKATASTNARKGLGSIAAMQINPKVPQLKAKDMGGCEEQLWVGFRLTSFFMTTLVGLGNVPSLCPPEATRSAYAAGHATTEGIPTAWPSRMRKDCARRGTGWRTGTSAD